MGKSVGSVNKKDNQEGNPYSKFLRVCEGETGVKELIKWFHLFSGRSWAATTTEGLLVYSLDGSLVFDPYDLDLDVTPASIRKQLRLQEWTSAIVLAFRLNEKALKQEVLETVPHEQSESTILLTTPRI